MIQIPYYVIFVIKDSYFLELKVIRNIVRIQDFKQNIKIVYKQGMEGLNPLQVNIKTNKFDLYNNLENEDELIDDITIALEENQEQIESELSPSNLIFSAILYIKIEFNKTDPLNINSYIKT